MQTLVFIEKTTTSPHRSPHPFPHPLPPVSVEKSRPLFFGEPDEGGLTDDVVFGNKAEKAGV